MKIVVTSICKNEEQFVERWVESAREADQIVLIDTGSTDQTVKKFIEACIKHDVDGIAHQITISPWRFDQARNAGLALIPSDADWVIDLDLDEVLVEGWHRKLRKTIKDNPEATRIRYPFVWSWNDDGTPAIQFNSDKVRTRNNYLWKHPVHECLYYCGLEQEVFATSDMSIHHFPDNDKPRSQYLGLMELAVKESPEDDRMAHYYARELYYYTRYPEALEEFKRHLSLNSATWNAERAMSMVYMAKIYYAFKDKDNAMKWSRLAVAENPNTRETWMTLAEVSHFNELHVDAYNAVWKALEITQHPMLYMSDPKAWGYYLYDIGSISAYCIGSTTTALAWGKKAIELNPDDQRLKDNLKKLINGIS